MRWVLAIVAVVVVIGGVIVLGRSRGGPGGELAEATREASAPDVPAAGGIPAPAQLTPAERRALEELNAELAKAEPVAYRSDEQRLAEARAWVAANRPADRPYNELEAKMLALMDVLADGDKRSAEWTMNMSQIEVEMIRAIDADGNGQVTDGEIDMFIEDGLASMLNPMEHPYLQQKFDTDGDGEVSPDEMMNFASEMTDGALAGAIERGQLEAWDADQDGFLTDDERAAGRQAMYEKADEMLAQFAPEEDLNLSELSEASNLSEEELAGLDAETARQVEAARAQLDSTREMMASQLSAQALMEAMRLDNLASPDPAEMMESMPKPPEMTSFDGDGDGNLSEAEAAVQQQAMTAYQEDVERWSAEVTAQRLREQFEHAASQHDTDGDGRMSEGEWEERVGDLLDERDRRLFQRSYDLDGSGRVDASELTRYLEWYRDGSLRADSNYDGAVDGRDLELMAHSYQRQYR